MVYSSSTDSVTTPGFTWTNDNNTGMYQPSANQVGIACDQQPVAVFKQGSLDVTGNVNVEGEISINGGAISQSSTLPLDDSDSIVLSNSNLNVIRNNRIVNGRAESYMRFDSDNNSTVVHIAHTDKSDNMYITVSSSSDVSRTTRVYNMNGTLAFSVPSRRNHTYMIKANSSGQGLWYAKLSSTDLSVEFTSVATDSSSNVYVMGSVNESATLSSSTGAATRTCTLPFIAKYDVNGTIQWDIEFSASPMNNLTIERYLYTDSFDNVYALLNLQSAQYIRNSDGMQSSVRIFSTTNAKPYIIKWNSSGNCISHVSVQSSDSRSFIVGAAMWISDDAMYMLGRYSRYLAATCSISNASTSTNIDSGKDLKYNDNEGSGVFVVKWSLSGTAVWSASILGGASAYVDPTTMSVDALDNVYVSGSSKMTFNLYDSTGTTTTSFRFGSASVATFFVAKYNSSGNPLWCSSVRSPYIPNMSSIDVDGVDMVINKNGDAFVAGYTSLDGGYLWEGNTQVQFMPKLYNVSNTPFLVKWDSTTGALKWWTYMTDSQVLPRALNIDNRGYVHVSLRSYYLSTQNIPIYNVPNVSSGLTLTGGTAFILRYTDEYIEPYKLISNLPVSQNGLYKYILNTSTTTAAPLLLRNAADNATLSNMSIAPQQIIELIWQSPTWYLGQT
jgi:hypothetical protein